MTESDKDLFTVYITFKITAGDGYRREGPYRITRDVLKRMQDQLSRAMNPGKEQGTGLYPAIATDTFQGSEGEIDVDRPTLLTINFKDVLMIG